MKFISVYEFPDAKNLLYQLLAERTPEQSISHKSMPSFEWHCGFVDSHPYRDWRLMSTDDQMVVGSVYVSKRGDVGIFVFGKFRCQGHGHQALQWARSTHCELQLYANINPKNEASVKFFERHGATLLQLTYKL